jgi:hypothetical protein
LEHQFEAAMVEPTDVIMPILQRIQTDVATVARDLVALTRKVDAHTGKLDAIEGYLTYQLGISSRTIADVETLKNDIREIRRRVEVLEKT